MKKEYAYKDIIFAVIMYIFLVFISNYYKYEIIYDTVIIVEESFYSILFLSNNIIICLVAMSFLVVIIFLVWFTSDAGKVLTRGEFIYGSTFLIFTLCLFELIKFGYILFYLEDEIEKITIDKNFLANIKNIDFALFSDYLSYLSYLIGSIVFVSVFNYRKKEIKIIAIGLMYLIYLSFIKYIF
jgi:hypothetical protein